MLCFWNPDFLESIFNLLRNIIPRTRRWLIAGTFESKVIASKSISERSAPDVCIGIFSNVFNDFNRKSSIIVARFSPLKSYELTSSAIPFLFHKQVLHPRESHICNPANSELHSFCHPLSYAFHFLRHVLMLSTQAWHI